jgi:hypothetical protein
VNLVNLIDPGLVGIIFVLLFFGLILVFAVLGRRKAESGFRTIPGYTRLVRSIGLAVEAGKRVHISLGRGTLLGPDGPSALVGLSVLKRVARSANVSDRPPVATSGEGALAMLSQDTLREVYRSVGRLNQYEPTAGQVSGLTPFSYAAGTMPVVSDEKTAVSLLIGHFGSEVALITEAAERSGSLTLAGSDQVSAQAVIYAAAQEPLIGEDVFAAGAYLEGGTVQVASLHAQDVLRWVVVAVTLIGAVLKFLGIL